MAFEDLSGDKVTANIHVPLDTYLVPRSRHETKAEDGNKQPLLQALSRAPNHCVILGNAGAGKTTSIKKICVDYFASGRALLNYNFPILIQLHEVDDSSEHPLLSKLTSILSLEVAFKFKGNGTQISNEELLSIKHQLITVYLDSLSCLILLDGFDEISSDAAKRSVTRDFELLTKSLSRSRVILTSRNHEFNGARDWTKRFELASLTLEQVETFANRWLGSTQSATKFLAELRASPFYDVSIRPLTIAHLCAIYERTGAIPEKPKSAYERIVNLLLRNWDNDRGVKRTSAYSKFDVDRKRTYLSQLSYELTVKEQRVRFESRVLRAIYEEICDQHGLPKDQSRQVANEIESHTGLLVQSGHDHFEFAHKSLREYLAADYIVRLPAISYASEFFALLPSELAIATSLSSRPGDYLVELLRSILSRKTVDPVWYSVFAERLALEKPDLATGRLAYTTAYILHLIGQTNHQQRFVDIFSKMLPADINTALSDSYTISGKTRNGAQYMRTGMNNLLPERLFVPQALLRR